MISLAIAVAHGGDSVKIGDSDDTAYGDKLSDRATIQISDLPALPPTQAYEGWFVSDDGTRVQSAGILETDANGNVDQTFWLAEAVDATDTLVLSFSGVEPLSGGFHYEGWAIIDGAAVGTGKFNVDADRALVDLSGNPIPNGEFQTAADLSLATAIVITIEPDGDTDAVPVDTHVLSGGVAGTSASLTVGHSAALGDDFSSATGTFILATPIDDPEANENSGIWFLDLSSGTPAQGLQLPTLPAGWVYEGWVVMNGTPVTTGVFTDPNAADLGAPFSGTGAGPAFPGEDFLVNAPAGLTFPTDLAGQTAVISIEPSPDDSAGPFTLKPLSGAITADATDHVNYAMDNNAAGFPTGTASIRVSAEAGEPTGENLFADFNTFVVSIEPVPDLDPLPSADKPLIHTIPAGGILHIRHLTYSWQGNPPYAVGFHAGTPKGIAVGLREQAWAAWLHADLSLNSTTLADAKAHAEHVVNIIEGSTGTNFGDLDGDGSTQNPGDGFGVLNYAADTVAHAGLSASAAADDPVIVRHAQEAVDSANNVWAWTKDARDGALDAQSAPDLLTFQLIMQNVQTILNRAFWGFDADADGTAGRIPGEGGAVQAYWAAQDMGQYLLTPPAAPPADEDPPVEPPVTGDTNVPNMALAALVIGAFLLLSGAYIWRRSRKMDA